MDRDEFYAPLEPSPIIVEDDEPTLTDEQINAILDLEWPWDDRDSEIAEYERAFQQYAA